MKNKKILIIIISLLVLIGLGVLVYFKFIKGDEKTNKPNNNSQEQIKENETVKQEEKEEKQEEVKIPEQEDEEEYTELIFKTEKEIEGLYDEYKSISLSNKTTVNGKDITAEIEDITVKIQNDTVVFTNTNNNKSITIDNIGKPISLALNFDVSNEYDAAVLYVLNDNKELYRIDLTEEKIFLQQKVQENVDAFSFIEGNNMILTYSEGQNLILITKSGDEYKLNGKPLTDYNKVYLYGNVGIGYKSLDFVKYNNQELIVKGVFLLEDDIYVITNTNDILVYTYENKVSKKEDKFNSLEINDNIVKVKYESSKEEKLEIISRSYYDGKIIEYKDI